MSGDCRCWNLINRKTQMAYFFYQCWRVPPLSSTALYRDSHILAPKERWDFAHSCSHPTKTRLPYSVSSGRQYLGENPGCLLLCHYGHHRQETRQFPSWKKVMHILQSAFLRYSPPSCPKMVLEVSPIITSKPSYLLSIIQNSCKGTGLTLDVSFPAYSQGGEWARAAAS